MEIVTFYVYCVLERCGDIIAFMSTINDHRGASPSPPSSASTTLIARIIANAVPLQ